MDNHATTHARSDIDHRPKRGHWAGMNNWRGHFATEFIVPEAPTLSHLYLRLIVSIAVQNEWPLWTKDVTMAYLQSSSPLSRTVYIRSNRSSTFVREQLHGHVLRVSKPLYGLADSG
jgi:hypothetical protein